MTELFTVYWGPGAKTCGAFSTVDEAEDFIRCLLDRRPDFGPRDEFEVSGLSYQPDPLTFDM